MTRNSRTRFCDNNFAGNQGSYTYSSQNSSFPFSNALNDYRNKVWIPEGNFEITATNNKIYYNDGADQTATLTIGSYNAADLASEIDGKMGTGGCTFSSGIFTITYPTSITLQLSNAVNAAWDTLGFTTGIDVAGTSFVADSVRIHTSEWAIFDFGSAVNCSFLAIIGLLGEDFTISPSATVTLKADNINAFVAPAFSVTATVTDRGVFRFNDDQASSTYRYWKLEIIDRTNNLGSSGIKISNIYLGDYLTFTSRNINTNFKATIVDPSISINSNDGTEYFAEKTKYQKFDSLSVDWLTTAERDDFEDMFLKIGRTKPFYISIDPLVEITTSIDRLTKYVLFDSDIGIAHVKGNLYSIDFSVKEAQ